MLEITVKPTLGSYIARAKGHKVTASRSEGQIQAAMALLRKLELWEGHLQEQDGSHLPQGHKLFHFHTGDEINQRLEHSKEVAHG